VPDDHWVSNMLAIIGGMWVGLAVLYVVVDLGLLDLG